MRALRSGAERRAEARSGRRCPAPPRGAAAERPPPKKNPAEVSGAGGDAGACEFGGGPHRGASRSVPGALQPFYWGPPRLCILCGWGASLHGGDRTALHPCIGGEEVPGRLHPCKGGVLHCFASLDCSGVPHTFASVHVGGGCMSLCILALGGCCPSCSASLLGGVPHPFALIHHRVGAILHCFTPLHRWE